MSFDGLMTKAITEELQEQIITGRISRIYQPYKTELVFTIRAKGKNHTLLLSANPMFARIHLTEQKYENPPEPPMFCMLLRKYIEGSIIEDIQQIDMERIIVFLLKGKDELGDTSYKQLFIEIMGRHSNITLVDKKTSNIIDSIKHISPSQSSVRTVLPGQTYELPPAQQKANPLVVDNDTILKKLHFNEGKMENQLVQQFAGFSPLVAKEIVFRAHLVKQTTILPAFQQVMEPFRQRNYEPQIKTTKEKEYFHLVSLTHIKGEEKKFATVSEMLDRFFYRKGERERVKQLAFDLERFLKNEYEKNEKKVKKLEKTLRDARKAEKYQRFGELLIANLHNVKKGDTNIEVVDYYDENGATVTIPLDPQKSPSDNAQHFFKKYTKAKNSVVVVQEQIKIAKEEMLYLQQLIQQIETAAPKDVEEIREELIEEGYLRQRNRKKKKKQEKPQIEQYLSSTNVPILVGKNNKQNEYLTNRLARQDELWLHTKDIPGSHVVIRSTDPDETTIVEAATIAAFYSKARYSSSVPVDYTKIRHVKKPNGAKPGFVIYDQQTTVYVTPNEDIVLQLKAKQS